MTPYQRTRYAINAWWAIQAPYENMQPRMILPWTCGYNRTNAIQKFVKDWIGQREQRSWKWYYRRGWRCVRVTIEEVT